MIELNGRGGHIAYSVECDAVCIGSNPNCAPCSELNRGPYTEFVNLADLARGVRAPPSTPEFSIASALR